MSKHKQIVEYLKEHKEITSWDAIMKFKYTRLSSIICDLRKDGFDIVTINEKNADGNGTHARYILK